MAVSKPPGMLTAADVRFPGLPSLIEWLHADIAAGKSWAVRREVTFLMNVHVLDAEISGVILLARSKEAQAALANLFGSEKPVRAYTALVSGSPVEDSFECSVGLSPDRLDSTLMRANAKQGKRSKTTFTVVQRFTGYALLRCHALTDRRHQVRVHLRHLGLPVLGDSRYGGRPLLLSRLKPGFRLKPGRTERPLICEPALHAGRMDLDHPVTGEPLSIVAPWPNDMTVAVKYLERYAPPPAPPENPS